MFFVVQLLGVDKSITIPSKWVRDGEKYIERFVNYSLNSSQKHLCYWNSSVNAISPDGIPNAEFPPNFLAETKTSFPSGEACYTCRIIKFKNSYEDAEKYRQSRREQTPAVYFERRVFEAPLPNLVQIRQDDAINVGRVRCGESVAIDEMDNRAQENLIPREYANPVVLLENIDFENPPILQENPVNDEFLHPFDAEVHFPADDLFYTDQTNEPETAIKYEVSLEQVDFDEVDGILNEARVDSLAQFYFENDTHAHDNIDDNEELVGSKSGVWKVLAGTKGLSESDSNAGKLNSIASPLKIRKINVTNETVNEALSDSCKSSREVRTDEDTEHSNDAPDPAFNRNFDFTDVSNDSKTTSSSASWRNMWREITIDGSEFSTGIGIDNSNYLTMSSFNENEITISAKVCSEIGTDSRTNDITEPRSENDSDKTSHSKHGESNEAELWKPAIADDEDILYVEPEYQWPAPKTFVLNNYIKRENDRFSGNLPFCQKRKDDKFLREYIVGYDRVIKIPQKNVDTFIKWSTHPYATESIYDRKLVQAMMILCSTKNELAVGKLNGDVKEFIMYLLNVRVKGDSVRMDKFDEYVQEKHHQTSNKSQS